MNPLFLLNVRYGFDRQGIRAHYGAYLEVLNVLNQTPIAYQEWDNDAKKFMNRRMNGILPNAGFTVTF